MELSYDWKIFQSFFYPKRRLIPMSSQVNSEGGPLYLVTQGRVVVALFAEGEDLSEWGGATLDEVIAEYPHREIVFYDQGKVDQSMDLGMGLPHFYDQIQYFRLHTKPQIVGRSRFKSHELVHRHFLLQLIQCWWQKFLPSTYGIYIQLDDHPPTGTVPLLGGAHGKDLSTKLFLIVQHGRLNSFHVPDLSSMIRDRRRYSLDIVKYLAEKYLLPVQGVFLSHSDWNEWSELAHPWQKISQSLKLNRNQLVPCPWSLRFLIKIRAHFGF